MSEIITVGLDLAKNVCRVHGAGASTRAVLRRKLKRAEVLEFLAEVPSRGGRSSEKSGRRIGPLGG